MSEPAKSAPAPTDTPRWATTVVIPTTWTPQQALAVFELIDDLRERLCALDGRQIQDILQQEQGSRQHGLVQSRRGDTTTHHSESRHRRLSTRPSIKPQRSHRAYRPDEPRRRASSVRAPDLKAHLSSRPQQSRAVYARILAAADSWRAPGQG